VIEPMLINPNPYQVGSLIDGQLGVFFTPNYVLPISESNSLIRLFLTLCPPRSF